MSSIKLAFSALTLLCLLWLICAVSCMKSPLDSIPDLPNTGDTTTVNAPDDILAGVLRTQNCDTFNFVTKHLSVFNAQPATGIIALGPAETSTDNGWRCTSRQYKASEQFTELNVMGQIPFYPTWLGDGASIATGGNKKILTDRKPWLISTDLNVNGLPSEIVEDPDKLSSYREALQRLLNRANFEAPPPANVSFEIDSVYSKEQAEMLTGANFGGWGAKVSGQYNYGNQSTKARLLVRFVQKYFTVDMDEPETPCTLFDTLPDLSAFGTSPMYVSSVIYGRVAYLMVESSYSMDSTAWALDASYSGFGYDGGLHVHSKAQQILNNSHIRGFVLGGSGAEAVGAVNGFEGLKAYILGGGVPSAASPGAPIGYRFKNLADNSDVKIVLASEYTVRECDNIGIVADVAADPIEIFKCGVMHEGPYNNDGVYHKGSEFDGNGPDVTGEFLLERRAGNKEVWLVANVTFTETADNYSMAIAHLEKQVYAAPPGKILGAFPDLDKVTFFYTDQKTDHIEESGIDFSLAGGTFIRKIRVVGDSDGSDMECDPDHDCGIRFFLDAFKISLKDEQ